MDALRQGLQRAEFEAIETAVRFYQGRASVTELRAAARALQAFRQLVAEVEQTRVAGGLIEFPLRPASPAPAGH